MSADAGAAAGVGPIYLDYAATTPVDARVAGSMAECLQLGGVFGNPSSLHRYGRAARQRVERARAQAAELIGAPVEALVWTSGATESNNLAILGTARAARGQGAHLITSRIEHKSVLEACRRLELEGCRVTYLRPDRTGLIDPLAVAEALKPETVLVSIMHANNETGVLQDIAAIGRLCRERGVPLHVDAAQSAGRLALNVETQQIDLLSFTAHKLYGPKGIGALYVRRERRASLQPMLYGGGQERGLRSGTLPVHQIVGFGHACELAREERAREAVRLERLRERLWSRLSELDGALLNGHPTRRLPGILSVSFTGVEGESLVAGLHELALGTSAACASDSDEPSHVLRVLGRDASLAQSTLRFSLGRFTRAEDIETAASAVHRELERLRAASFAAQRAGTLASDPTEAAIAAAGVDGLVRGAFPHGGVSGRAPDGQTGQPDPLSAEVRRCFESLAHAGAAPAGPVGCGQAGREADGARVRFELEVRAARIGRVRYRAYGCPHTLAACEWLATRLEGRDVRQPLGDGPMLWAEALGVPPQKLGRLLVVEDALRAALAAARRAITPGIDGPPRPDAAVTKAS